MEPGGAVHDEAASRTLVASEPSYTRKVDWAEKHLAEMTRSVLSFMDSEPYIVADPIENDRGERFATLEFTDYPDTDVALIAGDVLYNLRTAFDYLVGSLVAPNKRSEVLCPILHEPVWDIPKAEGENKERTKNREKWHSLVRRIGSDDAVKALQDLMPLEARAKPPEMHPLDVLNWLSNKDRHQRLSVIAWGLGEARAKIVMRGSGRIVPADFDGFDFTYKGFCDGARIPIGKEVAFVKLKGTPVVVIHISQRVGNVILPSALWMVLAWLRNEAIPKLAPFSRSD